MYDPVEKPVHMRCKWAEPFYEKAGYVPVEKAVLACFNPLWPNLNFALARFASRQLVVVQRTTAQYRAWRPPPLRPLSFAKALINALLGGLFSFDLSGAYSAKSSPSLDLRVHNPLPPTVGLLMHVEFHVAMFEFHLTNPFHHPRRVDIRTVALVGRGNAAYAHQVF